MVSLDQVSSATREFLSEKWNKSVEVLSIQKIFGGASRETYRLQINVDGAERGIILRRDPPSSLIDTDRELEFGAYARVFDTDIPVPEALFLENDDSYLEQPFSIMAAIDNCQTDVTVLSEEQRQKTGRRKYEILGCLAAKDPLALNFDDLMPVPELSACAAEQLDYWAKVIRDDEIHPQPIAQAAIRWLRRNMPPPAQKLSIVHGDYRTGNFLFDETGQIQAILDWEMCHLGDPLEDLAWSLDPLWRAEDTHLAGRLIPDKEAIDLWEAFSGLTCDPAVFHWWRVFVALKAIAIWISSSEDHERGEGKDSILAMAGWVMTDRQNRVCWITWQRRLSHDSQYGPRTSKPCTSTSCGTIA